ncbi:MAG: hypothetical protein ACK5N8_05995 [Alphaproteobacteria bacterium]
MTTTLRKELEKLNKVLDKAPEWALNPLRFNFNFDINNNKDVMIFSFISRQYQLAKDIETIIHSNQFSCGAGTLLSSLMENVLLFVWIAEDIEIRSNLFREYDAIRDLKIIPENNPFIKNLILQRCRNNGHIYKRKNKKIDTEQEQLNYENYIDAWYKNEEKTLKDIAKNIKLTIKSDLGDISFLQLYEKSYNEMCDMKHINAQDTVTGIDFEEWQYKLQRIVMYTTKFMHITNTIFVYIYDLLKLRIANEFLEYRGKLYVK